MRVWRLCRSAETHCLSAQAGTACRGCWRDEAARNTLIARATRRSGVRAWQIVVGGAKPRLMYVLLSALILHACARFLALRLQP